MESLLLIQEQLHKSGPQQYAAMPGTHETFH